MNYSDLKTKKITRATVKSIIKKYSESLFINVTREFDGMTDGCEPRNDGFVPVESTDDHLKHTLGVEGAWFVGNGDDYFTYSEDDTFAGIDIFNACGSFTLAFKK